MKIALVQMSMGKEISENLDKSLKYCDMAENCDLVFFPEIQLTPFFPQYHKVCVDHYCIDMDNDALVRLCRIRTCARKGADLIIVPTANTKADDREQYDR